MPMSESEVVVYRLYGHYSFERRDGGLPVKLILSDGFTVMDWLNRARLIVGPRVFASIEQAIYHGFARIVP